MYSGAVSAGKSRGGCIKAFLLSVIYPGSRGLICRKEARALYGSTYQTLRQVIPNEYIIDYRQMKGEIIVRSMDKNYPSTIVLSGLDKRAGESYPQKIGSTEYNWIFVDEGTELDEGDWNMLITRLRYRMPHLSDESNRKIPRQMFTATNPDSPHHFLYKFFFEDMDNPNKETILTTPYDNPTLTKAYIDNVEKSLSGIMKERLLLGKWVVAEGVIYSSFDPIVHVAKSSESSAFLPLKDYKDILVGADSNYPLPRAGILIGIKGDGKIDVLDEFYKESSHVEELAEWVAEYAVKADRTIKVYHDPSDPSAIDKLNMTAGVMCEKADNTVLGGISEVSRQFDNNLITIHPKCVNFVKELLSYRWELNRLGDKPKKEHDHACFVAGTKIMTNRGLINIEKLRYNDLILTREGNKPIELLMVTKREEVYQVEFSNGETLVGTRDHPVWVKGEGFVPLRDLRKFYKVEHITNNLWYQSDIMERTTTRQKKMAIGEKLVVMAISIGTFGKHIKEIFHQVVISTTKTITRTITKLRILNVSLQLSILNIIQSKISKRLKNISIELDHLPNPGMQVKKVENGTGSRVSNRGKTKSLRRNIVNIVRMSLNTIRLLSSVQTHANQQTEEKKAKIKRKDCVNAVGKAFKLTNIQSLPTVHVIAVRKLIGNQDVYNLAVKDCHEYYANGILVSNCDAIRYVLYSHLQGEGRVTLLDLGDDLF